MTKYGESFRPNAVAARFPNLENMTETKRNSGTHIAPLVNALHSLERQNDVGLEEISMAIDNDWSTPKALAIPKEGYFTLEQGRYGATYPRTPACRCSH